MNRWSALAALLLAFVAALALRLPNLSARPLHNDEAVNAIKVTELFQTGRYKYDPDEYHGPTLHYLSLPFLWGSGAKFAVKSVNAGSDGITESKLRLVTVFFGAALILLLPLFRAGLSYQALAWSAVFVAISPAMVFYSRYFIHEIILVFFTALTLGAGWQYVRTRAPCWAALAGAGVGLMYATKETFVLTMFAITAGVVVAAWWSSSKDQLRAIWNWKHGVIALAAAVVVWALFFTSFFSNWSGLMDSIRTYFPWLKRAGGHSPHIHPWYFYLERLGWFHPAKSPVWSEALIMGLAMVGGFVSIRKRHGFGTFIAVYTIALTAVYSAISYKTPWCLLSFLLGMILLAGIGASALVEAFASRPLKALVVVALLCATAQLAYQAHRASVAFASDRRNPYVYAQTVPDILNLVNKLNGLARVAPADYRTVVKVIAPDGDYWPLPWYLRRFQNVGWYDAMPADPFAPIIITGSTIDARLDEKSERKWIMVGYTELRPQKFLELYVELELWKKYVATLPRKQD